MHEMSFIRLGRYHDQQKIKTEKGTTRKAPPAMEGALLRISLVISLNL
jgi:hypothetical protein